MHKVILFALTFPALLLAGCSSGGSAESTSTSGSEPSARPTTSAVEVARKASSCPNPHGGACLGPLEAGTYRTSVFKPRTTYTVPAGWVNAEDLPGNFLLHLQRDSQDGEVGGSYLGVYQNVHAAAICAEEWQEGVDTTPEAMVAWYQSIPGLIVSTPKPVTVGGLDGYQIDLDLEPGVDTCQYGPYVGIPLIIGDGVSQLHHVILEEIDVRLIVLDWHKGNVTLEITNEKSQHSAEEFRALVQPIVDSLRFRG